MANIVYIGTSLDGYIADRDGGLDWLQSVANPHGDDMGFTDFMSGIDALIMGRNTFETVCGFDCDWPYTKPVFVLSNTLTEIPEEYKDKAELISGSLQEVISTLNQRSFNHLYIDGGKTVQSFLQEDLIDELIVSTIPMLLGGGTPLFGDLPAHLSFELVSSKIYLDTIVQTHYRRSR